MEYAAGVKKAQYNKVKLENRKMLIKPSYLITAVGIAFCVAFTVYGMQKGLFTSQEAMEQFLKPFGIWGPLIFCIDTGGTGRGANHSGRGVMPGRRAAFRAAVGLYI